MKLLVTGATGFTGRHFVEAAQSENYEVIRLSANLMDSDDLRAQIDYIAPDYVVHLAAISFVGHQVASDFYAVNVIGTLNLLDALSQLKKIPQRILLASSANVYGNCVQSPITEMQPPAPVNHYATSKIAMEYMAKTYQDRLPVFFVRPFNYTGPGQAQNFIIPKLVTHYASHADNIALGNIDVEREFNDVRFVCAAYLQLLQKAESGEVYNICSNQPVTLSAVMALLHELTGHTPQIQINPAFVRSNEIQCLCGSPEKLKRTIGNLTLPTLRETLQWMLSDF